MEEDKIPSKLDARVNFYSAKDVKRELTKAIRKLAEQNNTNQWKISLEMICQLLLFSNSLIEFLQDRNLLKIYNKQIKDIYPPQYQEILKLYNFLTDIIYNNISERFF